MKASLAVKHAIKLLKRDGCEPEFISDRLTEVAPIARTYKFVAMWHWQDLPPAVREYLNKKGWTQDIYDDFLKFYDGPGGRCWGEAMRGRQDNENFILQELVV